MRNLDDAGFEIILASRNAQLRVGSDETVLDVLEDAGIEMEWFCRRGSCGACELRVISGTPDHRDRVLTETERIAGRRIITCVSRALTRTLTLDI